MLVPHSPHLGARPSEVMPSGRDDIRDNIKAVMTFMRRNDFYWTNWRQSLSTPPFPWEQQL
jgi:hypothetical protein